MTAVKWFFFFFFPLQQQVALYSQFSCFSLQKIALLLSSTHLPLIFIKTVGLLVSYRNHASQPLFLVFPAPVFTLFSLTFASSCLSLLSLRVHRFSWTDTCEGDLELSMVRHQPEGLDQLQAQTQFTRKELQSLYRGFKNVRKQLETLSLIDN